MNGNKPLIKRRLLVKHSRVSPSISEKTVPVNATESKESLTIRHAPSAVSALSDDSQINRENILFVYLDVHSQLIPQQITALRTITDNVQTFSDESTCYEFLQKSIDRIFFICPTNDKDLVRIIHDLSAVEAIFVLSSDAQQIDRGRLPKIELICNNFEELLVGLRSTLQWFEETQMDLFAFDRDRIFLWLQLWKEELMKTTDQQDKSNKEKLVKLAQSYYHGNAKLLQSVTMFGITYQKNEALQWTLFAPFPSRFLHQALRTRHQEHLEFCRFLLHDNAQLIQRSKPRRTTRQFYRGMKLSQELVDRLMSHSGKLICAKDYFICIKSRMTALQMSWSLDHRADLRPVLFKVTCDPNVPFAEITTQNNQTLIVFDLFTSFRLTYVSRGPVSIVRMEPADDEGRSLARVYRAKHKGESLQQVLDHLSSSSNPPPTHVRSLSEVRRTMGPKKITESFLLKDQTRLNEYLKRDEVDQALTFYQHMKPRTVQVLHTIGQIYAEKKGDYDSAIHYYKEAIRMEKEKGQDSSATLTQLAIAHENKQQFDEALSYHTQVYEQLKKDPTVDRGNVANSLLGIANAQCGKQNLLEALKSAQQALSINESLRPRNEKNIAMNLAIIANIQFRMGNTDEALKTGTRAMALLEANVPPDSPSLAAMLNNLATMQLTAGLNAEAKESYTRALKISEKTLPAGHPKRVTMENNVQKAAQMEAQQATANEPSTG